MTRDEMARDGQMILIVEDSPTQAEELQYMLEKHNFQVATAANGLDALALIERLRPLTVISDIVMPGMDGYELCRQIKGNKEFHDTPVILLTSLSDPADVITGLECGADYFIMKPYHEQFLLSRVQHILANRNLGKDNDARMGLEIFFRGKKYFINSDRLQILNLLLSTYETAIQKSQELIDAQHELRIMNEQLEETVTERTMALQEEIAERRRAQQKLCRLNRLYTVLSKVNEALIRIREQSRLCAEICRIIVEDGGFRMSWLGIVDQETLLVHPFAHYGHDEGYLELTRVSADPAVPEGRGPTGSALRQRQYVINNDTANNPSMAPWREQALSRGYLSSAAFPLLAGEGVLGVLILYAAETGYFNEEEIQLLSSLADDVAFAMEFMKSEEQRRLAEAATANAKEEWERTFDAIIDPIMILDTDFRIVKSNRAMADKLGMTPREAVGLVCYEAIHGTTEPPRFCPNAQLLADGLPRTVEIYEERLGGHCLVVVSPLFDAQGKRCGSVHYARDINQRKQIEEELRQSERQKSILNRIANVFLTVPDDEVYPEVLAVVLEVMESRFGVFGFIGEDGALVIPTMTRDVWDECQVPDKTIVFPPDTWGKSLWGKALNEKKAFFSKGPFHTPIGHIHIDNFLTTPLLFGNEVIGLISVANRPRDYGEEDRDLLGIIANSISPILRAQTERDRQKQERQQAEDALQQGRNHLANIIDSMPAILVGMNRDETISQWNREAERATGITAAEAVGQPIEALLPEFAPSIKGLHAQCTTSHPVSLEKLIILRGNERHFYDLMLYPLVASDAEGAVVRIEEVTERARMQELMVQTEKMMSVGGLAAGMAHEINNPLGIINQAAQNIERRLTADIPANREAAEELGLSLDLMRGYYATRQVDQFIANIHEATARASRIVTNMLQFSRQSTPAKQPASLAEIMNQAVELAASDYDLKKKYDFRSIEIVREYDPALPPVPVVTVEIEQVILNLLKNAAEAMAANPPEKSPRLTLGLRQEDNYAVLEVTDNGPGMEELVRSRVFEPFFTTKEPGSGTGLGLSVSFMIVTNNHQGFMAVDSAPGAGARFTVRLPLNIS